MSSAGSRPASSGPRGNVYNFPFWQYVDDMYYYMHNLAAVPPVVWTNAAHRNGVRMFAAVTADFDPTPCVGGREFDKLFVDPPKAADQLFKIVNAYRFDGWMFDVENCATAGPNLLATMKLLRAMRLWNGAQVEVGYYEGGGSDSIPIGRCIRTTIRRRHRARDISTTAAPGSTSRASSIGSGWSG